MIQESVFGAAENPILEAFLTQSYGKSTIAFYQFDVAREKAKKSWRESVEDYCN